MHEEYKQEIYIMKHVEEAEGSGRRRKSSSIYSTALYIYSRVQYGVIGLKPPCDHV